MQIDFHYYVIRILAEKAGFAPADAQTIAYASQYVDDAIEYKQIKLVDVPELIFDRLKNFMLEPTCTAHRGMQMLSDFSSDVQKKVYLSFHFLPYEDIKNVKDKKYDYVTSPNSPLAKALIKEVLSSFENKQYTYLQKLIKLGIAVHTFSDTWAHQGFSGRHNTVENDIEEIEIWEDNDWQKISFLEQAQYNLLPAIGHAEAYEFPDYSHLKWRYKNSNGKNVRERDNTKIFCEAAKEVFNVLKKAGGFQTNYRSISAKMKKCFEFLGNIDAKIENYKAMFPEIQFDYDEYLWRNNALKSPKSDLAWFYFHQEALNQRNFIISKVPEIITD